MNGDREDLQRAFVAAGVRGVSDAAFDQFAVYLKLLTRWNTRFNLTSVREPKEIMRRHFAESAFVAQHLPDTIETLLDYGSGAGFPGLPIAICRPEIEVTLAESQGKKVAFLREVVREAGISSLIFGGRVQSLPLEQQFDGVILRAVEKMEGAIPHAAMRAKQYLLLVITQQRMAKFCALAPEFRWREPIELPNSSQMVLMTGERNR